MLIFIADKRPVPGGQDIVCVAWRHRWETAHCWQRHLLHSQETIFCGALHLLLLYYLPTPPNPSLLLAHATQPTQLQQD